MHPKLCYTTEVLCPISNQHPEEERLNRITHGLGLVLSLIGLGALCSAGTTRSIGVMAVCLVYGLSLVQLFAVSTLYHHQPTSLAKSRLRILDHCAIYVLIAGSYTPFLILSLGGWKGWSLLIGVWLLAFFGIRYKLVHPNPFGAWSVVLYLAMGWSVLLVLPSLFAVLSAGAQFWLVAGGVAYTLGGPFYAWQSLRYSHGIWHLFVLMGAAFHYLAVLFYVL